MKTVRLSALTSTLNRVNMTKKNTFTLTSEGKIFSDEFLSAFDVTVPRKRPNIQETAKALVEVLFTNVPSDLFRAVKDEIQQIQVRFYEELRDADAAIAGRSG